MYISPQKEVLQVAKGITEELARSILCSRDLWTLPCSITGDSKTVISTHQRPISYSPGPMLCFFFLSMYQTLTSRFLGLCPHCLVHVALSALLSVIKIILYLLLNWKYILHCSSLKQPQCLFCLHSEYIICILNMSFWNVFHMAFWISFGRAVCFQATFNLLIAIQSLVLLKQNSYLPFYSLSDISALLLC